MQHLNLSDIFELLPVLLATISAVTCSRKATDTRRQYEKFAFYCATLASCLLIVAQLSYWVSLSTQGEVITEWFANATWTIFNTITMATFIALSARVSPRS